jgi:hypothetical protein
MKKKSKAPIGGEEIGDGDIRRICRARDHLTDLRSAWTSGARRQWHRSERSRACHLSPLRWEPAHLGWGLGLIQRPFNLKIGLKSFSFVDFALRFIFFIYSKFFSHLFTNLDERSTDEKDFESIFGFKTLWTYPKSLGVCVRSFAASRVGLQMDWIRTDNVLIIFIFIIIFQIQI